MGYYNNLSIDTRTCGEADEDARYDASARKGNERTFIAHLARQLMRQDSWLLQSEAVAQARKLYAQGVRDLGA